MTKTTKRALLASTLSLILCVSMLIGTTYAWFTDKATTGVNNIVAGNLDIALYNGVVADGAISYSNEVTASTKLFQENALWEPGYTEVAYLKVENKGNLALKYRLTVNVIKEVIGKNKDGGDIKLSEVLKYDLVEIGATDFFADRAAAQGAIEDEKNLATETVEGHMIAGAPAKYYALIVYMPTAVGNDANHNGTDIPSLQLGVNLVATQDTVEYDSFNNTYDDLAQYPAVPFVTSSPVTNTDGVNDAMVISNVVDPSALVSKGDTAVYIPTASLQPGVLEVTLKIEKGISVPQGITVETGKVATAYDISLADKNGNSVTSVEGKTFTVQLNIGKYHDPATIRLYHYAEEMTGFTYDADTGILEFTTDSFSPFTVIHEKEKIRINYVSNTGVPVGTLTYEVDGDNSEVFSRLKIYENFIAVEEFKEFTDKVASGGNGRQQLVGMPYYYFGSDEPVKVSYGDATFFYNDMECTDPASFPTESGNYTVYCNFANHYLSYVCFSNPLKYLSDMSSFGDTYALDVARSGNVELGLGSQAGGNGEVVFVIEMKDASGDWVALPDGAYNSSNRTVYFSAFAGEGVTLRIADAYVVMSDAEGNVMYHSDIQKVPATEFVLSFQ